jgi:hypothetical protein
VFSELDVSQIHVLSPVRFKFLTAVIMKIRPAGFCDSLTAFVQIRANVPKLSSGHKRVNESLLF